MSVLILAGASCNLLKQGEPVTSVEVPASASETPLIPTASRVPSATLSPTSIPTGTETLAPARTPTQTSTELPAQTPTDLGPIRPYVLRQVASSQLPYGRCSLPVQVWFVSKHHKSWATIWEHGS
jgi:hypothetical protein